MKGPFNLMIRAAARPFKTIKVAQRPYRCPPAGRSLWDPEVRVRRRDHGAFCGFLDLGNPVIWNPIAAINGIGILCAAEYGINVFPDDHAFLRNLEQPPARTLG